MLCQPTGHLQSSCDHWDVRLYFECLPVASSSLAGQMTHPIAAGVEAPLQCRALRKGARSGQLRSGASVLRRKRRASDKNGSAQPNAPVAMLPLGTFYRRRNVRSPFVTSNNAFFFSSSPRERVPRQGRRKRHVARCSERGNNKKRARLTVYPRAVISVHCHGHLTHARTDSIHRVPEVWLPFGGQLKGNMAAPVPTATAAASSATRRRRRAGPGGEMDRGSRSAKGPISGGGCLGGSRNSSRDAPFVRFGEERCEPRVSWGGFL